MRGRCVLRCFAIFAAIVGARFVGANAALADDGVGPVFDGLDAAGESRAVRFAKSDGTAGLRLSNGDSVVGMQRLSRPIQRLDPLPRGPLSGLTLANGDVLTASVLRGDGRQFELRLPNGREPTLPMGSVSSVQLMPGFRGLGEAAVWRDENGQPLAILPDSRMKLMKSARLRIASRRAAEMKNAAQAPLVRGQAVIWITSSEAPSDVVTATFDFGPDAPSVVVTLSRNDVGCTLVVATANSHRGSQQLTLTKAVVRGRECCLRAMLFEDRFMIAVNQEVIASGSLRGGLQGIELKGGAGENELLFGPSWVQSVAAAPVERRVVDSQLDALVREGEDVLFGKLQAVTRDDVTLTVRKKDYSVPRSDVLTLHCGDQHRSADFEWVSGTICRVHLQPQSLGPECAAFDALTGAVTTADDDGLEVSGLIGWRMRLDWEQVRAIEPLSQGAARLIGLGTRHLGNSTRPEFSRPTPDGIQWQITVPGRVPEGAIALSMSVTDLIPAGPKTLRGTPFLNEVRAGFRATKVFVNGTEAGTLNFATSTPNWAGEPVRISLPLDRKLFRFERNVIAIKQTAAGSDNAAFDDCEVGNVMLEVR